MRIRRSLHRRVAAAVTAATVLSGVLAVAAPVVHVASAADGTVLNVTGHGNGHGIGMSQWGAYGYAADHGWSTDQILDHYYGGTVAGTTDATSITVRLMNLDDQQTAVVHDRGTLVVDGVAGGPWRSVVAREASDRNYTVWARPDAQLCPSASDPLTGWTVVATGLTSVTVRTQTDVTATADPADLLAACEPSGKVRSYRGVLRAVNGTAGENRTVNEVPLEQYLRAIVATEMSASWAPKGSAALRAQAIAARSFGLAENRYSYAKTCDLICQSYPGAAWRSSLGAAYTRVEQPAVDTNVAATAGVVRRVGSTTGPIALTMFSSSSGGWTAASTLPFPAVIDDGDDTAGNPYHQWTATIATGAIEKAWPAIGSYTGLAITSRSGQGDWGGRVLSIVVTGTAGQVSLTGDTFRRAVGLRSNWFDVTGTGVTTPAPAAPATPTTNGCDGRDAPPILGQAAAGEPARFSPMVPVRLIDTRDGTGTDARPLGLGCTLQVHPQVAPGTTSVAVNIVTVDPAAQGFITAYPCGIARTFTSAVQSQPGRIASGSVIVPLGVDGSFCVFSNVRTDVVIDMTGSFSPDAADRFEPIVAQRRFDSRQSGVKLDVGQVVRVQTRGFGAGAADSTGASITIHALEATVAGWVAAWPCDSPRPWASSVNVNAGESVTNHVDVAVGATGEVCLMASGPMHLAVDVNGWYGPSATTDFHAVVPVRVADSREGQVWSGQFAKNSTRRIAIASAGGLPGPDRVRAVVVQLTAVSGSSAGWVTVHPCLTSTPDVSMLRFPSRTNVAVLSTDIVSASGEWCVVASNPTHLVVDVSGWFG